MDLKEYLQQQAEKDAEALITEGDRQHLEKLMQKIDEAPAPVKVKTPWYRRWQFLSGAAVAAVAVIIAASVVLINDRPSEFLYSDKHIVTVVSELQSLQTDLKYFSVIDSESTQYEVRKSYDSVSGDKLYYSASTRYMLSEVNLVFVINERYDYKFDIKSETSTKQLTDYSVAYAKMSDMSGTNAFNAIKYSGWIKLQTETVYFNYLQPDLEILDDETFFAGIQQIVGVK